MDNSSTQPPRSPLRLLTDLLIAWSTLTVVFVVFVATLFALSDKALIDAPFAETWTGIALRPKTLWVLAGYAAACSAFGGLLLRYCNRRAAASGA